MKISGRKVQKAVSAMAQDFQASSRSAPDLFETLHKPSVKNECDGLLGLMQTLSRVLVHNGHLFVQKAVAWLD